MKKNKAIIGVIFLLTLLATVFLSRLTPTTIISTEKTTINNLNYVSTPKTSATPVSYQNFTTFDPVDSVSISGDGKYIAVTSNENITLFNRTTEIKMWNFTTNDPNMEAKISATGEFITVMLSTPPYNNVILLFNKTFSTNKKPMWNYTLIDKVNSIDISADGTRIVVGGNDQNVTLLDNEISGNKLPIWTYNVTEIVKSVAISADGNYVAAGHDTNVTIFDTALGTPIWSYNVSNTIEEVDISADGRYIVVAHHDNISLLDSTTKTRLWKYDHREGYHVENVEISADGKYIIARAWNSFKVVFDNAGFFDNSIADPKLSRWNYCPSSISQVGISDDGRYAIAGFHTNISLLDRTASATKEHLWEYEMEGYFASGDISAIGDYIVAGCNTGKVYLFYHDVPIPPALLFLLGDDDDDDDDEPAIPFGNYSLIFIALGILSLIVVYRRKLFTNKN